MLVFLILLISKVVHYENEWCEMSDGTIQKCVKGLFKYDEERRQICKMIYDEKPRHIIEILGMEKPIQHQWNLWYDMAVYYEKCLIVTKLNHFHEFQEMSIHILNAIHYLHVNGYFIKLETASIVKCNGKYKLNRIANISKNKMIYKQTDASNVFHLMGIEEMNSKVYNIIYYGRLMYNMLFKMIYGEFIFAGLCFETNQDDIGIKMAGDAFKHLKKVLVATMNCDVKKIPTTTELLAFQWFQDAADEIAWHTNK
eukprot:NODE_828_length_3655_cov_0.833802.p1 type:complete len:255 gc:universal NODE_828_length_3655_cov_0.833802:912-148(-)